MSVFLVLGVIHSPMKGRGSSPHLCHIDPSEDRGGETGPSFFSCSCTSRGLDKFL